MKKFKKVLSLVLVALVMIPLAVLFTGCTEGDYHLRSVTSEGVTMTRKEFWEKYGDKYDYENAEPTEQFTASLYAMFFGLELDFDKNGRFEATIDDLPDWAERILEDDNDDALGFGKNLTWKEENDIITIYAQGGEVEMTFKKDGRKLICDLLENGSEFVFKK